MKYNIRISHDRKAFESGYAIKIKDQEDNFSLTIIKNGQNCSNNFWEDVSCLSIDAQVLGLSKGIYATYQTGELTDYQNHANATGTGNIMQFNGISPELLEAKIAFLRNFEFNEAEEMITELQGFLSSDDFYNQVESEMAIDNYNQCLFNEQGYNLFDNFQA